MVVCPLPSLSSSVVKLLYFIMHYVYKYIYIRYIWYHAPIKILHYYILFPQTTTLQAFQKNLLCSYNVQCRDVHCEFVCPNVYERRIYRYTRIYDIIIHYTSRYIGICFSCDTTCKIIFFDVTCTNKYYARKKINRLGVLPTQSNGIFILKCYPLFSIQISSKTYNIPIWEIWKLIINLKLKTISVLE